MVFFQNILLSEAKSDIVMHIIGSHWAINFDLEQHPYIMTSRFWFMKNFFEFACPLPQRIASFYNILTPFSAQAWVFVLTTYLLALIGFVIINQVYKALHGHTSKWKW